MADAPARRVRAQYTSRACDECRRRKVKCSGTEPCQCCVAAQTTCRFNQESQRGRRRVLEVANHGQNSNRVNRRTQLRANAAINRTSSLEDELARIGERATSDCFQQYNAQQQSPQTLSELQRSHDPPFSPNPNSSDTAQSASRALIDAENWFGPGNALLGTQNRVLKDISAENSPNEGMNITNSNRIVVSEGQNDDVDSNVVVFIPCALANNPRLAPLIRLFFTDHNNCFYCLDPDPFVSQLSNLLENHSSESGQLQIPSDKPDLISLAALACMVLAYTEFLSIDLSVVTGDTSHNISAHQSWNAEARRMLDHYPKRSHVNLHIVQFYLVATYYAAALDCVSQEPVNGAYQAVAMAITSAYSIGLNNEARWSQLSKEEKTARRCLWASIDLMDKQVAYKCGRPYLIQQSEVAVSDLIGDIKNFDGLSKDWTADRRREGEEGTRGRHDDASSSTRDPTFTPLSLPAYLRLQYIQGLIEITRAFVRSWRSFFSVRRPSSCEKEEVQSIDALLQRIQRNLPAELSWNTVHFSTSAKTSETRTLFRVRLLLFTRINILRLAIHHASIRGRRGDPALAERYSAAEYKHTLTLCDDIACTSLTALLAYLDCCAPGSCLTTYATSTALECIYHPIVIAQLGVADGMIESCQLSGRMITTLTEAVQVFRKLTCDNSHPKLQLPKNILTIIEGILNHQKNINPNVAPTSQANPRLTTPAVLPSLKDQLNSGRSDFAFGITQDVTQNGEQSVRDRTVEFNASYFFDPSLLPAPFLDNSRSCDFMGNGFFPGGCDIDLERPL